MKVDGFFFFIIYDYKEDVDFFTIVVHAAVSW